MDDYEEFFDRLSNNLCLTDFFDDFFRDNCQLLCDVVARAYAIGDKTTFLMSSTQLNTKYKELNRYNKDGVEKVNKYIDDKITEGFEEYSHAKFAFSDCGFDELMEHIK